MPLNLTAAKVVSLGQGLSSPYIVRRNPMINHIVLQEITYSPASGLGLNHSTSSKVLSCSPQLAETSHMHHPHSPLWLPISWSVYFRKLSVVNSSSAPGDVNLLSLRTGFLGDLGTIPLKYNPRGIRTLSPRLCGKFGDKILRAQWADVDGLTTMTTPPSHDLQYFPTISFTWKWSFLVLVELNLMFLSPYCNWLEWSLPFLLNSVRAIFLLTS